MRLRLPLAGALVLLAASLAASLAACGSNPPAPPPGDDTTTQAGAEATPADTGPIIVRTDRAQYRPGERVALTIVNQAADTFYFNPCTRAVEREDAGGWEPVAEEGRMCTMEAWLLQPGETREAATELPADLAAGRYRLVIAFTIEGGADRQAVRAASAAFAVAP